MHTQDGNTLLMNGQLVQMKVGMQFQCLPSDWNAYVSGILKDKKRYEICHCFGTRICELMSLPEKGNESDDDVLLTVLFLGEDEPVQIRAGDLSVLSDAEQFV